VADIEKCFADNRHRRRSGGAVPVRSSFDKFYVICCWPQAKRTEASSSVLCCPIRFARPARREQTYRLRNFSNELSLSIRFGGLDRFLTAPNTTLE